jgi:hypothetical protein
MAHGDTACLTGKRTIVVAAPCAATGVDGQTDLWLRRTWGIVGVR